MNCHVNAFDIHLVGKIMPQERKLLKTMYEKEKSVRN